MGLRDRHRQCRRRGEPRRRRGAASRDRGEGTPARRKIESTGCLGLGRRPPTRQRGPAFSAGLRAPHRYIGKSVYRQSDTSIETRSPWRSRRPSRFCAMPAYHGAAWRDGAPRRSVGTTGPGVCTRWTGTHLGVLGCGVARMIAGPGVHPSTRGGRCRVGHGAETRSPRAAMRRRTPSRVHAPEALVMATASEARDALPGPLCGRIGLPISR